jgi:tripartite-type tricarboxylate transporter receptor subunit TctC
MLAPRLGELLGQQVVVDNKPGSNGNIAADFVAKSPPDGYTFFLSDTSTYAIGPHIYGRLSYDPLRDLIPVVQIATPPMYVVVHPSLPVNSMQELVAHVRARPGQIAYASAGNASIHHLTTELFRQQAGLELVHVPYKGSGQSAPALIAGDVQLAFIGWTSVSQAVRTGRLRAIGFASGKRSQVNPDLPTIAETVLPGFDVSSPMGLGGPAGLPRDIIERVQNAALEAARAPETRARMIQLGLEPAEGSAEVYGTTIRNDYDKFGKVVRAIGLKVD